MLPDSTNSQIVFLKNVLRKFNPTDSSLSKNKFPWKLIMLEAFYIKKSGNGKWQSTLISEAITFTVESRNGMQTIFDNSCMLMSGHKRNMDSCNTRKWACDKRPQQMKLDWRDRLCIFGLVLDG